MKPDIEPSRAQLKALLDGLNRCHVEQSASEFLRVWIRDWTEHKIAALAQPEPSAEPVAQPDTCTWHQDGDSESSLYATSCKRYFMLEDGTPEDNRLAWCCYCGKRLVQDLITEEDDSGEDA